jgi:hypothetical protein
MNEIVSFNTAREAAKTKATPRPAPFIGDRWDALAEKIENMAGLAVQLTGIVAALEQTVAKNEADIAKLKEGVAALIGLLRKPEGTPKGE